MEAGTTQTGQPRTGAQGGMARCIDNCIECSRICLETISHCLKKGGQHAAPEHINHLSNCVEICQTSAKFMISGSNLHVHTCGACAEVCATCADDCERIADDAEMKRCVDICRRCAESCREMAAH